MNYSLSWSLGLPFSWFTWTLDMECVPLVTSKFGFPLKNWHINMYHMHIWKNEQLPVQVPGVVILMVHLDPLHDLCHTCKLKIWILIEKLAYKHVSYAYLKKMNYSLSWSLGLLFLLFPWTLDMAFVRLVTTKFGFPLKNGHMNMYHMHIWKKTNYTPSWSLRLLFLLFPWTLDMAFVALETSEFGFPLKK